MDATGILDQNLKLSSHEPTALPKTSLEPGKPGSVLPDAKVSRFPVETGGDAPANEVKTGEPLPDGGGSPNSHEPVEVYTQHTINTNQGCALADTLKAVRVLRDEWFRDNPNSRPGLLFAQLTFIFQRIERGIPSGREAFIAILRAAQLPESIPEAAER